MLSAFLMFYCFHIFIRAKMLSFAVDFRGLMLSNGLVTFLFSLLGYRAFLYFHLDTSLFLLFSVVSMLTDSCNKKVLISIVIGYKDATVEVCRDHNWNIEPHSGPIVTLVQEGSLFDILCYLVLP